MAPRNLLIVISSWIAIQMSNETLRFTVPQPKTLTLYRFIRSEDVALR